MKSIQIFRPLVLLLRFNKSRNIWDAIPIIDTVGELVGAELGSLLGSKGSKVRNPCFLHFFSCYEVI
jgi:hypothetical protein